MVLTHILDTLLDADGNLANGRMVMECPAFIASDGTAVAASKIEYRVVDGAVDFWLAPTEGSDPQVQYTVDYFLMNGAHYREIWNLPAAGPITISQARGTA